MDFPTPLFVQLIVDGSLQASVRYLNVGSSLMGCLANYIIFNLSLVEQ